MKKLIFTISAILLFSTLFAQDFIYKNDGSEIKSKVIEITPDFIKYRKWENQSGPIYNINITYVFMVVYENGEREIFKKEETQQEVQQPVQQAVQQPEQPPQYQPQQQAQSGLKKTFQSNVQFGITLGGGIASASYNYKNKDVQPVGSPLLVPVGGFTVNFHVVKQFAIQTGLYYMGKGDKLNLEKSYEKVLKEQYPGKETKIDGSFKSVLGYLQVPLTFNLVIPFGGSDNGVLIGPGAYFAYGITGKEKADFSISVKNNSEWVKVYEDNEDSNVKFVGTVPSETEDNTVYVKATDMGFVFNIGFKSKRFMISSITSIGLVNTRPNKTDSDYNPDDEKVKTICGTIAFTFFLN